MRSDDRTAFSILLIDTFYVDQADKTKLAHKRYASDQLKPKIVSKLSYISDGASS